MKGIYMMMFQGKEWLESKFHFLVKKFIIKLLYFYFKHYQ